MLSSDHYFRRAKRRAALAKATAALLVLLLLPSALRWLRDEDESATGEAANMLGPAVEARGVRSTVSSADGQRMADFSAERVEISADRNFATAFKVKDCVIYRNGKPFWYLQAGRVRFDQQSRDWQADGELSARGPDQFGIRSTRATWNQKAGELTCPDQVNASYGIAEIKSRNVIYNAAQSTLRCPQPLEVRSKVGVLTGPGAIAYIKERRIEFGHVDIAIHPAAIPFKR